MARIVSLGSALQDLYLIDHDDFAATDVYSTTAMARESLFGELKIGTKVDIDRLAYEVGGGGTNAATTFARHGHESIFIGNIGHDTAGDAILACLDKEGIDSSYVSFVPKKSTGCSVILLDTISGERTILTHRGASAKFDNLSENDLDTISPDWLYVTSFRGDIDTLRRFFKKAKSMGAKIMFNPGKLELEQSKKLISLLEYVDILLVNKVEASQIVPGTILTELLARLLNYVKTAIITDGSMGAIASDHQEFYRFGLYEDLPVKDTTGAGDAFGSGFLAHFAAGKSFYDSLVFASANSTSVVTKLGAKKGILTGKEHLHQMPIQEIKL
ncbi:carbohydrate kinase family protein [Candidatus Saccharibacteria bacterium]|nr:carbohydrate kinase family protein [Candidatus Saccharibacteria bacterium]